MKNKRREFLKMTGLVGIGIGLADASIFSGYADAQEKYQHTPYDKELAAKYGLEIAEPNDAIDPAPEWVQHADMFTGKRRVNANMRDTPNSIWKGYDIALKDTLVEKIVRVESLYDRKTVHEQVPVSIDGSFDGTQIKGVSLISHVPHSATAFKQVHEQGFRVIPYLHFTDIHSYYADQDVFLFQHPEILLKDAEGKWVHLNMDGTDRLHRLRICANSPSYWKLSLAYVKKMMEWGADGIFIDNVANRTPCFAPKFTNLNPEFGPYVHEHLFPEATHNYAFNRFLQTVRALVKSYGDDKVVVINSGIGEEFQKNADCCMWESFIYSWAWNGRREQDSWANIKEEAKRNERYLKAGRRITALSYLDVSRKEIKDDAYWAFCAARLVDFIWWVALENTGAEQLYQAHMGKGLQTFQEVDQVAYRTFENGVIALNDSSQNRTIKISLPTEFRHKKLLDLYDDGRLIKVVKGQIEVTVPAQLARIYLVPHAGIAD